MVIRPAGPGDAAALVALLAGGALVAGNEDPDHLDPYRAALTEIAADPRSTVLVATEDGSVVGLCQLIVFRHLQQRGGLCAEIESVHVAAARRGAGIGGALVEEAVRRAADAGCYRVQLTTNKARVDAQRFYARHGFVASHEGFKRRLG